MSSRFGPHFLLMFTGIIEKLGTLKEIQATPQGRHWWVTTGFTDLVLGESVAINGVCLTVTELRPISSEVPLAEASVPEARFFVSAETLRCTTLATLETGACLNLERALTLSTRLSGHLVQGHVDGIGRLLAMEPVGESYELTVEIPAALARFCVPKGSICLDGISLTLNRIESTRLSIMIIPHTWEHTRLKTLKPDAPVNIEVDVMAKYVAQQLEPWLTHPQRGLQTPAPTSDPA